MTPRVVVHGKGGLDRTGFVGRGWKACRELNIMSARAVKGRISDTYTECALNRLRRRITPEGDFSNPNTKRSSSEVVSRR